MEYVLIFSGKFVDISRLTRPLAPRAIPVAEHPNGQAEQGVGYQEREQEVAQVVVPRVPGHHHLRVRARVVAREGQRVRGHVAVVARELRAIHSGRVPTALRVDVEASGSHVPLQLRHVLEHNQGPSLNISYH